MKVAWVWAIPHAEARRWDNLVCAGPGGEANYWNRVQVLGRWKLVLER